MHRKPTALSVAVGALALVAAACGNSSDDNAATGANERTVNVKMVDVAFEPTELTVAKGESVRFVFENTGKTEHEAFLGTPDEQTDHDKEMTDGDAAGGGHDMSKMGGSGDTAVTVAPGETGEFTTSFADAGTYEIGCHEPGHYKAGMKITVTVN